MIASQVLLVVVRSLLLLCFPFARFPCGHFWYKGFALFVVRSETLRFRFLCIICFAKAKGRERSFVTSVARRATNPQSARNKGPRESLVEAIPEMVCDLLANCSFACVVALIDQANVSKICMRVRCCITAVCLFAHSGFGCIAVVAHGGMFALFSGDSDMNLWESNVEHSSGLVLCMRCHGCAVALFG